MTNPEKWPIGTKVKFNHDGLEAQGTIIVHEGYTVIVVIDDSCDGGWEIHHHEVPSTRKYDERRGWHVPCSKLVKLITRTKLGNQL